tara:strand:+ start:21952 stop:23670 length:1719 start_codon:yes stop_codon:yes gene_type:complete
MSDVIQFPQLIKTASGQMETYNTADDIKMSDLYDAPNNGAPENGQYDQTDTVTSFLQQPSMLPATVTGWSNQELADLHRTQRILALAGIATQVDHGLTDEGDPWFVFMDSQNEVFVHFSRFDGAYIVTSQMQEKPIKGDSLQDLVAEFAQRVKPVTQVGRADQNVVSLAERSRNVVRIHPSAALAALVWSIYLMSDELIAATPMISGGEMEDGIPPTTEATVDLHAGESDLNVLPDVALKAVQVLSDPEVAKQVADPYTGRDTLGTMVFSGPSMKAIGLGLSIVALTVGLPVPASVTDDTNDANSPETLNVEKLYILLTQAKKAALLVSIESDDAQQQIHLENRFADVTSPQTDVPAEAQNININVEFSAVIEAIKISYIAEVQSFADQKPEFAPNTPPEREAEGQTANAETATQSTPRSQHADDDISTMSSQTRGIKDTGFLQKFDDVFESFKLTDLSRMAQNEMAQLLRPKDADNIDMVGIPNPLAPVDGAQKFEAFNQEAETFLSFLLNTYSDVKVVNLPTEIIFIHMGAFDAPDGNHEIYAKSWAFDDGGIISTVGFKSDMAQFDLVA